MDKVKTVSSIVLMEIFNQPDEDSVIFYLFKNENDIRKILKDGEDFLLINSSNGSVVYDKKGMKVSEKEYPSLFQMSKNALGSVSRVVKQILKGEVVKVPSHIYDQRYAECHSCEHWDENQKRCTLCGCFTDFKLSLSQEKCPDEPPRWDVWENN